MKSLHVPSSLVCEHVIHFDIFTNPFQDIDRHPYLDTMGFVVNNVICSLICEPCKWAITPSQAQGHLNETHPDANLHIDQDQFQVALDELEVPATLPQPPDGGIFPKVVGLAICQGYQCHHCDKALGTLGSMDRHHHDCHHNQPIPTMWPDCHLQQLHPYHSRTMFQIQP
jgi:hypothetical protein